MSHRVAIVHDSLAVRGGAERVVLALAEAFPDAPIHTSLYVPELTHPGFAELDVRPGRLNDVDRFRRDHRQLLPLLSGMFRSMLIDADVVICSSSGFAHHVRTTGRKVVYCHTPARWIYDTDRYLAEWGRPVQVGVSMLGCIGRPLDQRAMREADTLISNSRHIAAEVRAVYARDATVIAPCSTLPIDGDTTAIRGVEPGFVLSVSRALGYKRLDVLVEAARAMPDTTFLHLGDGPHRDVLLKDAPSNVISRSSISDSELRWAYRNARSVAVTCAEDFGLVPLEAAAHGLTAALPRARGVVDHALFDGDVRFYDYASSSALVDALASIEAPQRTLDANALGARRFVTEMRAVVNRDPVVDVRDQAPGLERSTAEQLSVGPPVTEPPTAQRPTAQRPTRATT